MDTKYKVLLDKLICSTTVSIAFGAIITVLWQGLEIEYYGAVQYRAVDDYILATIMILTFVSTWRWLSNFGLHKFTRCHVLNNDNEVENLRNHNQFLILRVADLEQERDRLETLLREMYREKAEDKEQV